MKLKINVSLVLVILLIMNQLAFATDYSAIDSYKTNLATENFTDNYSETNWSNYNVTATKSTLDGEDSLVVNIDGKGHYIRRITNTITSGIVIYEFDMTIPNASNWSNSFQIGLVDSNKSNIPLFAFLPNGNIRSSIDGSYANVHKLDTSNWCTLRIEFDVDKKSFIVFAGKKGTTLTEISGLANNFYVGTSSFESGVSGLYLISAAQPALVDAYYIDNVKINHYKKAYQALNAVSTTEEAENVISTYVSAGLLSLPELYAELGDKDDILRKLLDVTLTSDAEITEIISGEYAAYEEKIYTDISNVFNRDVIGRLNETVDASKFGIIRALWYGDGASNLRDNYLGQGYNGTAIKADLDSDNILTVSKMADSADIKTVKFNENALSVGVNDSVVLYSSASKDSNNYCVPANDVVIDLSGKNLSCIDLAIVRGSYNPSFICADITYADGSVETYSDTTNRIPTIGVPTDAFYASDDFGKTVYPDSNGTVIYDERALSGVTGETDNRTKSYMHVVSVPLDISKQAKSVRLYAKSIWGAGSYGIFALTQVPASNDELLSVVKATDAITAENIDISADVDTINYALRCADELIARGIFAEGDARIKRLQTLLTMCNSYDESYLISTEVTLYNSAGTETDLFTDAKTVSVNLTYNNKSDGPCKAVAFIGFYDEEDRMLGLTDFEVKDVAVGVSNESLSKISVPAGTKKIIVFVWEDFEYISPRNSMTVIGG